MFSRDKSSATGTPTTDEVVPVAAGDPTGVTSAKGRPTPKRKDVEAANKRPLVPTDRRAAAKVDKDRRREERQKQQSALQSGDEKHLPARDKGPVRRYVRDHVDARWNLGEYFLFVALVALGAMIATSQSQVLSAYVTLVLYVLVLATVIDAVVMWRRLKKKLLAKFGEVPSGTMMYAIMRAFQIRRARLPKPRFKQHGHWPE